MNEYFLSFGNPCNSDTDGAGGTKFRRLDDPGGIVEGKSHVRFCVGVHRKPGAIIPTGGRL